MIHEYATESASDSTNSILDHSDEYPVGFTSRIEISNNAKLGLLNRGILFQVPSTEKQISVDKVCFEVTSIAERSTDARNRMHVDRDVKEVVMCKKVTGHENYNAPSALTDKQFFFHF